MKSKNVDHDLLASLFHETFRGPRDDSKNILLLEDLADEICPLRSLHDA